MPSTDTDSSGKRSYSALGASFATDILDLGADGFADWLLESFGGPTPDHKRGWFHYDEEMLFFEAFRSVAPEFSTDVAEMARSGITKALERFDPNRGSYFGLLEICGATEALPDDDAAASLLRVLDGWIAATEPSAKPPDSTEDAIALREILECVFRRIWTEAHRPTSNLEPFRDICGWAYMLLAERPILRTIVPAYAPLYILALAHVLRFDAGNNAALLDIRIESGAIATKERFDALYVFDSKKHPGCRFPYKIDELVSLGEQFVAEICNDKDFYAKGLGRRKIAQNADPFGAHSATQGTTPNALDPDDYLQSLRIEQKQERELESA